MTAQHQNDENREPRPAEAGQTDPIGPITTPIRSMIGRRALALVGTASVAALAIQFIIDGTSTDTTQGS